MVETDEGEREEEVRLCTVGLCQSHVVGCMGAEGIRADVIRGWSAERDMSQYFMQGNQVTMMPFILLKNL